MNRNYEGHDMLTEAEGIEGLKLARTAIEAYLSEGVKIEAWEELPAVFHDKRGVFVTLTNTVRCGAV